MPTLIRRLWRQSTAVMCSMLLVAAAPATTTTPDMFARLSSAQDEQAPKIPNDQLDSLVAPIALYPDPLLAQVLAASTYPLEIMQLQQFLEKHKDLKDQALSDAVMKQNWDPSIHPLSTRAESGYCTRRRQWSQITRTRRWARMQLSEETKL